MSASQRAALVERIRTGVPETTGVYLFRGESGRVMYVGKSVNLRRRMLDYFRPGGPGGTTRTSVMVHGVTDFSFVSTTHELLALLLEDHLIKREFPEYNTRQREFDEYCYLLLTSDEYPTLRTIQREGGDPNARIFGPFRDRFFTEELQRLVQDVFHPRACTEADPVRKCAQYDLGKCEGPCRGHFDASRYAKIVDDVVEFLGGEDREIARRLDAVMQSAAELREYERAAECKRRREFCQKFCARQRFLERFRRENLVVRDTGHDETTFAFERGRLCRPNLPRWSDTAPTQQAEDPRFVLDRGNLVYDWVRRHDNYEHRFEREGLQK